MITFLNKRQLGFILDINQEDARARMCNAWANSKKEKQHAQWAIDEKTGKQKHKVKDDYPDAMSIEVLSAELNLPNLQSMVNDIHDNFLTRPGTKKWILCDYPEKQLETKRQHEVHVPPALKSLLPQPSLEIIQKEWTKRFNIKQI